MYDNVRNVSTPKDDIMKRLLLCISLLLTLTAHSLNAKETWNKSEFSQAQVAQMLAPIALYPDSLLTHILIASTYPIEVVEAERWISKKSDFSAEKISKKLEDKNWEPSVKALVMFPKVLERLSDDLSWTQQLGDAFLQSEENVLQVIQDLRYQAQEAGNLDKMENVKVTRDKKNIIIQPVQKEVIYVPYYDTRYVYGNWHWAMNPPIYWDFGHRVSLSHHNPFRWHSGIHISLNYFFSAFHWNNRHVVVVDHRNTRRYRTKKHIVRGGYANRWVHKPQHRRGVTYSNERVNKRFNSQRPVIHKTVKKHRVSPRLHTNKKDYRSNLPALQRNTVNRSSAVNRNTTVSRSNAVNRKLSNTVIHKKPIKHEVLQRKFTQSTASNKAVTRYKSVEQGNVVSQRKRLNQNRTVNNKRVVNNKPSIKTQVRTEKPILNQSRSVQNAPKYNQPTREYTKPRYSQQSKPQRKVQQRSTTRNTNQSRPTRKSHSGSRHSEKRQERR